jgi:DNA repair exonuclease SbcCD nuclease subunit
MTIRIVHTADNHVDLRYVHYPELARERLRQERFDSLQRVVNRANERNAHFLVIAGDLFDRSDLSKVGANTVKAVVEILSAFEGDRVLVLPGNHDFCAGSDSALWARFRNYAQPYDILVLDTPAVEACSINDQKVHFFPCPCPAKTAKKNEIGWVSAAPKDPAAVRIGIAHGNVEGLGLDDNHRYFHMTEAELAAAGVHTWLLGHIHKPAPASDGTGQRLYFMAGSTTPESVTRDGTGSAWCIDVGTDGVERYESFRTGEITFRRITRSFTARDGMASIAELRSEMASGDPSKSVVDLKLTGELPAASLEELRSTADGWRQAGFLHLSVADTVAEQMSTERIRATFPDGTTGQRLLADLLASAHPTDAKIALDAINEMQPAARADVRGGHR